MRAPALALAAMSVTACAGQLDTPEFSEPAAAARCEDADGRPVPCDEADARVIRYRRGCKLPNQTNVVQHPIDVPEPDMDDCPACGMG